MRSLPRISRVPLLNAEARIAVLNWQLLVAKPLLQAAAIMRVSPYAAWALAKSAESGIELMLAQIDSVPDHLVGMVHSAIGRIRRATVMVEPFAGVTRTEEEVAAELSSAFTVASVTGVAMQVAVDLGSRFGGASP